MLWFIITEWNGGFRTTGRTRWNDFSMINLANLLTVKGAEDFLLSLTIADFLAFSSWAMILTAVPTFFMLLFITAPYGRYSTAGRWGPLVPARFGWFVMESPNLWMTILVSIFLGQANSTAPTEIALSLFLLHYTNRSIIFPLRLKKPTAMTFAVMASAFCYCCWNGFNQAVSLIVVNPLPAEKIQDPFFWLGVILFFVGFILNIHADTVLMNLRKETDKPGSYRIPYGGLFQYISCPNYGTFFVLINDYCDVA